MRTPDEPLPVVRSEPRSGAPDVRTLRRAAALALVAFLSAGGAAGCGGGGGPGGPAAPTTGTIEGRIRFTDDFFGGLLEREPNDTAAQANFLPVVGPRATFVVLGEGGADGSRTGAIDVVDALRLLSRAAQRVDLVLDASPDGGPSVDFDLTVLDAATSAVLGSSTTANTPEVVSFDLAADAPADVLITCAAGAGTWRLSVSTSDPAIPGVVAASVTSPSSTPPSASASADGSPPSFEAIEYLLAPTAYVAGRVLVRTAVEGVAEGERLAALVGGRRVRATAGGSHVVEFSPRFRDGGDREALAVAARLATRAGVRFAEPDAWVHTTALPTDPYFADQWHLRAVNAPPAWDITRGVASVVIGHLDGGVAAHPDLDAQRVGGADFVSDPSIAGDGGGRDGDPTDPGDRGYADGGSTWHGTHTAGIMVARADNAVAGCGVAPGCRFMPVRVTGIGGGTAADLADAVRYVGGLTAAPGGAPLAAPLRVANMSLGTPVDSTELREACAAAEAAGVLLVASAGNDGGSVLYPAAYPSVVAVGAVDSRLVRASYSNFGAPLGLVAAGGKDDRDRDGDGFLDAVLSTVLDESRVPAAPGVGPLVGTSMAAPQVAAAAALALSLDPTLTRAQLRAVVLATARDLDVPGFDVRTGAGLLDVGELVRRVLADLGTPRTDPPRLHLSATTLRFGPSENTAILEVSNGGGGTLHLAPPVVHTDGGAPWLIAFLTAAPPGAPSDALAVNVIVDPVVRALLATGIHAGSVLLTDGTNPIGSIRVLMENGAFYVTGFPVRVVAIDDQNGAVRASGTADPVHDFRFAFRRLAPGTYRIHAGTDFDQDGFFCEGGDACGDFGGAIPQTVGVAAGEIVPVVVDVRR